VKKIVLWCMSTLTALVLLFGYHTSTSSSAAAAGGDTSAESPVGTGTGSSATGSSSSGSAASSSALSSSASSSASSAAATTVTGEAADTRWGPVQVRITVSGGKVTAVDVVEYPDSNGRDQEINARALPVLVQETLQAQSAKIDMVSGATYTSDGYLTSLQSALDQAGL
jgi:uncharacterized protein with FMN-binding domain